MASREFTDSKGIGWKVWDVKPIHLHPVTRAEAYMEPWAGGWLAFECDNQKRRLVAPYPSRWPDYDPNALEALCRAATVVGAEAESADVERKFTSTRGREWTVRLHDVQNPGGDSETVLRFSSGDCVMDLKEWPDDWRNLSRQEFATLLLDAEPSRP